MDLLAGDLLKLHGINIRQDWFDVEKGMHRYEHFAPEPQALARSGCWMTTNSYVKRLFSLVIRLMLLFVSLFTMMLVMVTMGTPRRMALGNREIR